MIFSPTEEPSSLTPSLSSGPVDDSGDSSGPFSVGKTPGRRWELPSLESEDGTPRHSLELVSDPRHVLFVWTGYSPYTPTGKRDDRILWSL